MTRHRLLNISILATYAVAFFILALDLIVWRP